MKPRLFWFLLFLAAFAGLVLRVEVGRKTFISFDEWQHVFMASSARWADLSFELRTNAHPPLFFLLLRGIVRLGYVGLYRSISIASGVGSIIVVGLIARRILDSPIMQLLCAAAFALSTDAIAVSVEIRSYQLAVLLVLLAFLAWLAMFSESDGRVSPGSCIAFAICSSLAVFSHYSAVFFLGACVIASLLFRVRLRRSIALAFPCAVFAVEYVVHAGAQPMQGYLFDFYRSGTPNESLVSFVTRNSRNFFNLFSPLEIQGDAIFLLIALLVGTVAIRGFLRRWRSLPGAAILLAIVIVLELLTASLADKYPFGGMLRHEYIAGPFLLIASFVVLDALISLAPQPLQYAIPALLLTASVANAVIGVPKLIFFPGVVLMKDEFNAWRSAFPDARAVYVDHWGVIGHFIHTSDQPRQFVRRIPDDAVIDEYRVPGGIDIFYDKTRIVLDLSDPSVYRSFAACLRTSGVKELTLFFYSPRDVPIDQPPGKLESTVAQKAAEQGLTTTRIVVGGTFLAAGFKLN